MKRRPAVLGLAWAGILALNLLILPSRHLLRIQVEAMALRPLPLIIRAPGVIEAKASETLTAKFDAPVIKKYFKEGQVVKTGERLVELSRERIRLDYQERQNNLKNAEADVRNARRELKLQ